MMDSIGKPGTAGITRGVVVLLDDSVTVTVAADVELDVLLSVELVTSLLDVTTEDVLASDVLVELTVLETTLVLVELEVVLCVVVVVVPPPPPPPVGGFSGSRWKIPDSVPPVMGRPTANPSSGPLTYTE
jgi:hypothetical protein